LAFTFNLVLKLLNPAVKRSGKLGRLIRYIDWDKVKPLGAAAVVLQGGGARNPDVLHNKEVTQIFWHIKNMIKYPIIFNGAN
jgi:hypothetical protein